MLLLLLPINPLLLFDPRCRLIRIAAVVSLLLFAADQSTAVVVAARALKKISILSGNRADLTAGLIPFWNYDELIDQSINPRC